MTAFRLAHGVDRLSTARAERLVAQAAAQGVTVELVPEPGDPEAVRAAVREERADGAVLAFTDIDGLREDLRVAVVPKRIDSRDGAWLREGASLDAMPEGSRVGVRGALRAAQLRQQHPALSAVDIDETAEWDGLDVDAVVLAAADAQLLGRADQLTDRLDTGDWPPAPAQGAVFVEVRAGEHAPRGLQKLHHPRTQALVEAEFAVRRGLGDPALLSVVGFVDDGLLFLTARRYDADGAEPTTCAHAAEVSGLGPEEFAAEAREVAARVVAEMTSNREERVAE